MLINTALISGKNKLTKKENYEMDINNNNDIILC